MNIHYSSTAEPLRRSEQFDRVQSQSMVHWTLIAFVLFVVIIHCCGPETDGAEVGDGSAKNGDGFSDERAARTTGFETIAAGDHDQFDDNVGHWQATTGKLTIEDRLAKSGQQCLHLAGPTTVAVLKLADALLPNDQLVFACERWTARGPFKLRIEMFSETKWTEIFNGDKQVRVGRGYPSLVKLPIGKAQATRLRFTVNSPPNTGLLIDDLKIEPAQPQRIMAVSVGPVTYPLLTDGPYSPLMKLKIEAVGSLEPVYVQAIEMTLSGTSLEDDVESIQIVSSGPSETLNRDKAVPLALPFPAIKGSTSVTDLTATQSLAEGANYIWVACKLRPKADIDHQVAGGFQSIAFSNGQSFRLPTSVSTQRLGVAVRQAGDDGVHTYRIPGLATTNEGTLIAVYDVRYRNGSDLPGDIDIGMSRSVDGGRTWEPMRIVMDMGRDPTHLYDGVGDPAILVDRESGTIWVAGLWSHGNRGWHGSGPGLAPDVTGQILLARSDDDGVTWSKPVNITSQVKQNAWCLMLQGPGKGITMQDGTIVFAAQFQDSLDNQRLPYSTIIYSRDHGQTWQAGTGAHEDTTEAQVVELEPGVLMLNCRYNRAPSRVVMTTNDLGTTWHEHATSKNSLIEPGACMASLIDVGRETKHDSPWLLFSNPDSISARQRITVKASPDHGSTWPAGHQLLLDEGSGAGYSCMTMIGDQMVGILYEGSQSQLTFQRIPLSDLLNASASKN